MSFTPVELVHIALDLEGESFPVGRLALAQRQIWFEYHNDFIETGLEISPFYLPLKKGVTSGKSNLFEGLFGVFNDSLPDGWGRLLLDRQVRAHGIEHQSLTPLDRLAYIGSNGMGALTYQPDYTQSNLKYSGLNLDLLAKETQAILEKGTESVSSDVVLNKLYALGGSSGGARPKVLVGYHPHTKTMIPKSIIQGCQILPDGYEHWIVKFASSADSIDIGAIEYAYSLMAKAVGIEMPETHLFEGKGRGYFGAKRFDRIQNQKIHMHSACGLLNADYRLPSLDYETLMRATLKLCRDVQEVQKIFRLAVFNVFAHNRDDHSKNFAFLMDKKGTWRVAPAYDLTFSYGPGNEHSTMVMGEGKEPESKHLLALAKHFDIPQGAEIIEEVKAIVQTWPTFAEEAGVSSQSLKLIQKSLVKIT